MAVAIAAAVANGPAKLLVRRRRPFSSSRPTLIRTPRSTSFPSGHSAAAFAFAVGACAELPALAPALVPLAGAVAYSRVHTGVHYPSDVVAGVGIGIGSGLLSARLPWRARARPGRRRGPGPSYLGDLPQRDNRGDEHDEVEPR
jgi:undecaprenyl-diphosphatase